MPVDPTRRDGPTFRELQALVETLEARVRVLEAQVKSLQLAASRSLPR